MALPTYIILCMFTKYIAETIKHLEILKIHSLPDSVTELPSHMQAMTVLPASVLP